MLVFAAVLPALSLSQARNMRDMMLPMPGGEAEKIGKAHLPALLRMIKHSFELCRFHRTQQQYPARVRTINN
ncbi:hypothetical protein D3C78_1842280 [compost metagenome]